MSYKLPTTTDYMKEQMEHEPTRAYAEEMYETVKRLKPDYKEALEIGAAWGVSALSILLAGEGNLTSVDSDPGCHAPIEVEANNLKDRYKFFLKRSHEFWDSNAEKFDLIYIDGGHTYEWAHLDIMEGWKALKDGGLLIIDDVIHKYNREVHLEALEPHYGVAIASMEHIFNNHITQINPGRILLSIYK